MTRNVIFNVENFKMLKILCALSFLIPYKASIGYCKHTQHSMRTLLDVSKVFAGIDSNFNLTHFKSYRQRRTLIFEGSGLIKFVIGPTLPVNLGDPITWRSLICSYNLHGGHYAIPSEPLYPWDKYEDIFARSIRKLRHWDSKTSLENAAIEEYWTDDSRLFVYMALEKFINRKQADSGRACLLRSICENAQVNQHVGMLAELLNVVLTPGKEKIDGVYSAAYEAGKSGADCLRLFTDCPMGSNILDTYLEYL